MRITPLFACAAMVFLSGCSSIQSALHPTGAEAERVATLFWIMTIGGALIMGLVIAAGALAIYGGRLRASLSGERFVVIMGLVFPVVVLTALLIYGFALMRAGEPPPANPDRLRVEIAGELWWWRVIYVTPDGRKVTSANELHLPVGQPVEIALTSTNVIHSFWAPQLAGKLDMIPGRTNTLTVTATQEGISRGQCAEYCGGAHALMAFHLVAQTPGDFDVWLEAEASAATEPRTDTATEGQTLFTQTGCGACHAVRGTEARGTIGPDLTHVGSRHSLAAATLPNTAQAFARWLDDNQHIKPGNKMPSYDILSQEQIDTLATYLEGLQ